MKRSMHTHGHGHGGRHGDGGEAFGRAAMFGAGGFGRGFSRDGFGGGGFGGPEGFGGGLGGPAGRGGGRRRRLFDQSELQTLLLSLIAETPRHGYDLIREIEAQSGGSYAPSPGIVYPALTFMEEQGLIALADGETARKSYEVTEAGRKHLEEQAQIVQLLRQRLASLAEAQDRADPAPLRRAVAGLKMAIHDHLGKSGGDRSAVLAIADIIDEAARKIERIEL